jgi:transcriptional regulator with XRE-family HTH domain
MTDQTRLADRIREARVKRGWTQYAMCKRMNGVMVGTLRNLEGCEPTRSTHGKRIQLGTAVEIATVLWPDITLQHFYGADDRSLLKFSSGRNIGAIGKRQAS